MGKLNRTSTWAIRYTDSTHTWVQGRYADRGTADMNARLSAKAGLGAEVIPYEAKEGERMNDTTEELPVPRVELRRDGKPYTTGAWYWPIEDDDNTAACNEALKRLSHVQGQSWDWAMRYEGWSVVLVQADGTARRLKLNGEWA